LIGGLLSSFDLINSGLVPYADTYNKDHVQTLLRGARDLADFLTPVFDSPTGLPFFWINTTTRSVSGSSNTAVCGTLILEWHRLSDLTGDDKYRNLADKAESYLVHPMPNPIFPNLVGSEIDIDTGKFQTDDAGWHSGIDSFYEVRVFLLELGGRIGL
jgi:mannosyl-oligosaccharide alpha-1,2-mannosidase